MFHVAIAAIFLTLFTTADKLRFSSMLLSFRTQYQRKSQASGDNVVTNRNLLTMVKLPPVTMFQKDITTTNTRLTGFSSQVGVVCWVY